MVIGIGGISRAGKTSLSRALNKTCNNSIVLHLDDYIKETAHWDLFTRYPFFYLSKLHRTFNMEHPNTIDFTRLYKNIIDGTRQHEVVIVEGFLITHDTLIRNLLDKYIHIRLSKNIYMQRRMKDFNSNKWYANHAWNSYIKYGNHYADLEHMIVDGDKELDVREVINFLRI